MKDASTVYVGRGKNFSKWKSAELLGDAEGLAKLLGPTGNLRAPTLRAGKTLIVGFSEPMYQEIFG